MNFEKELDKVLLSSQPENLFYQILEENKDFKTTLSELFPEIKRCANEPQNNKWHIYNVLDHTLHAVKSINELSKNLPLQEQKILAYTMFYHDLGKPEALKVNMMSDDPKHSFFLHQEYSAEIVEDTINIFSFNEEEQQKIYTLVKNHDYFMLCYKNIDKYMQDENELKECVKDDIAFFGEEQLGKEMLKDLILVAKADNMAQNPEMTHESLEFLNNYEKTLNEISFDKPLEE